jgi:hypothetical protein
MATTDNERFVRKVWEVRPGTLFMQAYGRGQTDSRPHNRPYRWVPYVKGAAGACWLEASDCAVLWANGGLEVKACNDLHYGSFSRNIKNEDYYFRRGIAFSMIGSEFRARLPMRYPGIFGGTGFVDLLDDDRRTTVVCWLNTH